MEGLDDISSAPVLTARHAADPNGEDAKERAAEIGHGHDLVEYTVALQRSGKVVSCGEKLQDDKGSCD